MGSVWRAGTLLVVLGLLCYVECTMKKSPEKLANVLRQKDEKMQFKKGVRGECFETYLQLSDNAKEESKKIMYEMDGWHQLAKYDGNWRTVMDAVTMEESEIEALKSVIDKSEALEKIDPILQQIKAVKNYQRDMMKQMLRLVKLAQKHKYVHYFSSLDFIGKKELPCVKAIQESYASKYPVLLNEVTSEVLTATTSELDTGKEEMKTMIDQYGDMIAKLVDDATKNSEIGDKMKKMQLSPDSRYRVLDQLKAREDARLRMKEPLQEERADPEPLEMIEKYILNLFE